MLYMTFFYIYPSRITPSDLFSWFSKIQIPKPVRGCGKQNFMSVSKGVLPFSTIVENIFCAERSHMNMIIYNPREGGSYVFSLPKCCQIYGSALCWNSSVVFYSDAAPCIKTNKHKTIILKMKALDSISIKRVSRKKSISSFPYGSKINSE